MRHGSEGSPRPARTTSWSPASTSSPPRRQISRSELIRRGMAAVLEAADWAEADRDLIRGVQERQPQDPLLTHALTRLAGDTSPALVMPRRHLLGRPSRTRTAAGRSACSRAMPPSPVLSRVTCAPITRTIRGIRSEVALGDPRRASPSRCVASCDNVMTIAQSALDPAPVGRIGARPNEWSSTGRSGTRSTSGTDLSYALSLS